MLFILFLKILQLWKIRENFSGMKKGIFTALWISRKKNELYISLQRYYGLAKEFWETIAHNFYGHVLSFQTFPLQLQSQCSKAESDEADHDGAGAGADLYPECCPLSRDATGELNRWSSPHWLSVWDITSPFVSAMPAVFWLRKWFLYFFFYNFRLNYVHNLSTETTSDNQRNQQHLHTSAEQSWEFSTWPSPLSWALI